MGRHELSLENSQQQHDGSDRPFAIEVMTLFSSRLYGLRSRRAVEERGYCRPPRGSSEEDKPAQQDAAHAIDDIERAKYLSA